MRVERAELRVLREEHLERRGAVEEGPSEARIEEHGRDARVLRDGLDDSHWGIADRRGTDDDRRSRLDEHAAEREAETADVGHGKGARPRDLPGVGGRVRDHVPDRHEREDARVPPWWLAFEGHVVGSARE
jgi:hypothetical protein